MSSTLVRYCASIFTHTYCVLGVKPPQVRLKKNNNVFFSKGKPGVCDHGEFSDSVRDDFDKDGQPEVAIWLTKPEILWAALLLFPLPVDVAISQGHFCELVMVENLGLTLEFRCCLHSSRDISISGLGSHIATSSCPSLSKIITNTVAELAMVAYPGFAFGKKTHFVVFLIEPVGVLPPKQLPVVGRCRNHSPRAAC